MKINEKEAGVGPFKNNYLAYSREFKVSVYPPW